jgi:uncharacterized protein (DUF1330 family)
MSAYVIANVDIRDPAIYSEYVKLTPATVAPYGGRFIARGGKSERLEGDMPANRIVILEFDTYEQAKAWYDSENYRAARAVRQSASVGTLILVDGVKS